MSRQTAGFSSHLNSTQTESQEQHLAEWVESRRQERRLLIVPKTTYQEELRMAKMEGTMDGIGICIGFLAAIGIIALLIYHLNWWVIPALAGAIILGWIIKYKGGFLK